MVERRVELVPGWPLVDRNKGRHCATLVFSVVGPRGAVSLTIFTGWPHPDDPACPAMRPITCGIHIHLPKPLGEILRLEDRHAECPYIPGGVCYGDRLSSIRSLELFEKVQREGHEAMWKELEAMYEGHCP